MSPEAEETAELIALTTKEQGDFVARMNREGKRNKASGLFLYYLFMICRFIALGGSAIVPILALRADERTATVVIGAAVFSSEVFVRIVRPGAHSISQIRKADELNLLVTDYRTRIAPYNNAQTAFDTFATHARSIRKANLDEERGILEKTFESEKEAAPDDRSRGAVAAEERGAGAGAGAPRQPPRG